jgi:hypothetical protein
MIWIRATASGTESRASAGSRGSLIDLSLTLAFGAVLWSSTSLGAPYDGEWDSGVTAPGAAADLDGPMSVGDAGDIGGLPPGEAWATDCTSCDSLPCGCAKPCGRHRTALIEICPHGHGDGCWIGRADALILWRNAPPDRALIESSTTAAPLLNANGLDSTAAAGPRFTIMRLDNCTGHAWEATYLRAANFRSLRPLPASPDYQYALAPPGIYSEVPAQPFDSGTVNLGSRLQSFELNRHLALGRNLRWLTGFRWVEWQEQFTLSDTVATAPPIDDLYQTNCINSLYGGQIGLDANLLNFSWIRFDSVIKAGAYFNTAVQSSAYTTNDPANPGTVSVAVGETPASGAFVGELGMTAVMPITTCVDFRLGYFGLWLSGIAQPTQQLGGQTLVPSEPVEGSLNTNGGVVVQGVSIGLEGRW